MLTKAIQVIYKRIIQSLNKRELKNAFDALHQLINETQLYLFQDELSALEETYRQLLHYYVAGSNDPMREKIFSKLMESGYEMSDRIIHELFIIDAPALYFSIRRMMRVNPPNIIKLTNDIRSAYDIQNNIHAESLMEQLFKAIWTNTALSEDEMNCLHSSFLNKEASSGLPEQTGYPTILNCQLVSALLLSLQHCFDKRKLQLLITATSCDDDEVSIRAYISILITLYRYQHRLEFYPDLKYRIDTLAEQAEFKKIVYFIILRFILARETEKITNRMKEEIVPEMMKLKTKTDPQKSKNEFTVESFDIEMNPEWMEKFEKSDLGKKLEEFSRLQEEGADVMLFSFVHLKHFPFFDEISHWFLPFHSGLSFLSDTNVITNSLDIMTKVGLMCNSDLFSFYFSMTSIQMEGHQEMFQNFENQLLEWKQQQNASLRTHNDKTEQIIGHYIQDLYRFYKLFPRKNEFRDVFNQTLDFHNLPIIQRYFSDKNDLLNIAEYYLQKNYFKDALTIYHRLSDSFEGDEMLFQKKGYCLQMTDDHAGALVEYAKAEMINPDSKWLLRRTAQCYRSLKKPEKALDYYFLLEKLNPDNLSVLLNIGSCYLEMKNYTEALKYYFKVDYLDHENGKAWRPLAWCSFLMGKYEQARHYYLKILSSDPDYQDFTNAGHTEWALHQHQASFDYYVKSVQTLKNDFETFRKAFVKDLPELTAAGIPVDEIPFMLDKINYSI